MGRQKYRKQRQNKGLLSALTGTGLLILGFAALLNISTGKSSADSATESSVTPMEVSFRAPELSLENIEGKTQSLADFKGEVVLVNNWATWCPPCKAEMPSLKQFHDTHTEEGFTVIAVEAGDKLEDVLAFAQRLDLKFPIWLDPNGASLQAINNGSLPNSYVIDRTGTVRLAWTGEIRLGMLEKFVTPIIQESN